MKSNFVFSIKSVRFDEHYEPASSTRLTTNFANLARGTSRQQNLRNTLKMIDNRFNMLAHWDNPTGDRYSVELEIISADIDVEGTGETFPSIEILKTNILDHKTNQRIEGVVGNNFSSYVRDYDFSVLLLDHNKGQSSFTVPPNFGDLHGKLFKCFVESSVFKEHFAKPPVICLSVSDNKVYTRIENEHPILGLEYEPNEPSLTEQYFKKMGLQVRYFMPSNTSAPLAFYFFGDLLNDYTNLELISTISTMESFQKIYRPEIYNANAIAGHTFKPSLNNPDHSSTQIIYDREERSRLALEQGRYTQDHFIKPFQTVLERWSSQYV
jgi:hypothetical protein